MTLLLERLKKAPKTPKAKAAPSKSKGKEKEGKNSTSEPSDWNENNFEYENLESSSEESQNSETEDTDAKRMSKIEKHLEAIANQSKLQEIGVVRPYPEEWDDAPYPLRFKAPTPHTFDGKGLPNQHMYYFKSQTRNIVSNDAIMTRLFIGTLKGVAFEWFMKLPTSSIKKWVDLEKLFLAHFFKDDTKILVPTLLATK